MFGKLITVVAVSLCFASSVSFAQTNQTNQTPSQTDQIRRATQRNQQEKLYKLEYKLKKGEKIKLVTEQSIATKFQLAGTPEETVSRSKSTHTWTVLNVDKLGQITFSHALDDMDMWQKTGDSDPISYNSKTHKEGVEVHELYQGPAKQVGRTLAVFSVAPNGKILNRRSDLPAANFGLGDVIDPLPSQSIPVGFSWAVNTTIDASDEHDKPVKLKSRVRYQLARVSGQTAFISFKTEVLTPGLSEKIKSTIVSKLSKGEIAFNMETGRPSVKDVRWNGKAQGFEGPDSFLSYVSKMTKKIVSTSMVGKGNASNGSAKSATVADNKSIMIKTRDGVPVMRK